MTPKNDVVQAAVGIERRVDGLVDEIDEAVVIATVEGVGLAMDHVGGRRDARHGAESSIWAGASPPGHQRKAAKSDEISRTADANPGVMPSWLSDERGAKVYRSPTGQLADHSGLPLISGSMFNALVTAAP